MATGYTAPIYDGKDITFTQFALRCARAFGALVTMRDSGLDADIPDKFVPSPYHEQRIAEAKFKLAKAEAMTESDAQSAADEAYADEVRKCEASRQETEVRRCRYEKMLESVRAWRPPTREHIELQKFMASQLVESIKFDCVPLEWEPVRKTGAEFKRDLVDRARRDIAYHEAELSKDRARCDERNAWVRELRNSLPKD